MSWVAVAGAAVTVGGQLLKPKQKAPQLAAPIDLNAEARKSIAGNLDNQDSIEALLARANSFNQDQNISLMEKAMPGYGELSKKFTNQATDLLDNLYALPKEVEQNLSRLAAERGISAGTKGEFNDFSLLRDFGINSLQYGNARIGQAQSITQMLANLAPKVNPLSPMAFYVTPGQQAQVSTQNTSNQQAKNNADAAAANLNNDNTWNGLLKAAGTFMSSGSFQGLFDGNNGNLIDGGT
jgi:hypothetical protein